MMPEMVFGNIFTEVAALLLVAAAVSALALRLKQPLIVAYIVVGIVAGPSVLGLITAKDEVDLLAKMGIALLLFVVGLKLDLHLMRSMGVVALATGIGQVLFTSIIGYVLALLLGLGTVEALYVAVALTFSSTIIIVKLLSDKREIDSLHGRIAVGFLIVQDIVVVLVMIGLSTFGAGLGSSAGIGRETILFLSKGAGFIISLGLLMRYVLPGLLHHLARSREMLLLFSIAWAVALAALGDYLGFSKEVGAFLAGVSLASTPYREAIGSRLINLRDFLLLFFFLDLGSQLDMGHLGLQVGPAVALSLFVLIGNPLIVIAIMGVMGYRRRTGLLAGLTVAQISEFSLILGSLGVGLGHIGAEVMGLITLVGILTIGVSTYMILYSHKLYQWLAPSLRFFERRVPFREMKDDAAEMGERPDVILFGLGRYGGLIFQNLKRRGLSILGVDFDPMITSVWRKRGMHVCYGDAEDPEFPSVLPLGKVKLVISAMPQLEANLALLDALKRHGYLGLKAVTAHSGADAELLEKAGTDLVLCPFSDAAEEAAEKIINRSGIRV